MTHKLKKVLLLSGIIICCYNLHAQGLRRTCDVEPVINAPKDTVLNGKTVSIPLHLLFRNHGPDKMITGDAVIFILYTVREGQSEVIYSNIVGGQGNDSIPLAESMSYENSFNFNIPDLKEPLALDFCIQTFSEALANGDSVILAYYDPNKENNVACNRLTVMPEGGTTIAGQDGAGTDFLLYPNPGRDKLYIDARHLNTSDRTEIIIRDITGRIASRQTYHGAHWQQGPVMLNVAPFPSGLYTISVQTGEYIVTKKISIKQ